LGEDRRRGRDGREVEDRKGKERGREGQGRGERGGKEKGGERRKGRNGPPLLGQVYAFVKKLCPRLYEKHS